ncbi:MAG: AAA family ATPase [Cyanobacteria bacterium J06582_2]
MNLINDCQLVEQVYASTRYRLNRVIYPSDKRPALIKAINSTSPKIEVKRSVVNEYRLLEKFTEQTIIQALRLETYEREPVLVLADFAGKNLLQFWQSQDRSVADFLTLAIQLTTALEAIHSQDIIHQNIQPDSMLIDPDSLELKIIDLSLATTKSSTKKKLLPGLNLAYIAPEQTGRMNIPVDYRTDFYSTGIIFYQMLTGSLPYQAQQSLELIHCHLAQVPTSPKDYDADIPETLSSIVMKLLAKNPGDRYQSASALKADFEKCQTQHREQKSIELFELGALDRRSQFELSTKLYGRAAALNAIAESLARINSDETEILLLTGDSGVGKTALVNQVIPSICGKRGYFITGKFEPFTKETPYKAITQALGELIQQLLTETQENRQFWQQKIQKALGNNGKVITNILPELELIIGSQPDLLPLQFKERENLFNTVFVKFIQIFAGSKLPLILFLDNLQWADSSSLSLIELLVNDCQGSNLLIVGAYRDRQLERAAPLLQTIAHIAQTVRVNQVVLSPLTTRDISSLLLDSLQCDLDKSLPLAQLLWQRTHGNPFFVHLLLQSFYQEKLLKFDFSNSNWEWSINELHNTLIANYNVVELVCRNLNQLPPTCLQILKLAACIGNGFDLEPLKAVWQKVKEYSINFSASLEPSIVIQELGHALQSGIIVAKESPEKVEYQFVHDRVHQAVYSLLEPEELIQLHLIVGNFCLEQTPLAEIDEKIFEIVRHLNLGRTLLKNELELNRLIELNLAAGKKAKAANAYQVAANYLDLALDLLPSFYWQDNYALILAVYLQASEVHYLNGNFVYAEQLGNVVLEEAKTVLERVQVYQNKIRTHIAQNEMQPAVDTGLQVLKLLDVELPNNFTDVYEYTLCLDLKSKSIKSLRNLPIMSDRSAILAMEILTTIIPPVYIVKPELFSVMVSKMVELCLRHGNCALSAYAYALYGLLVCAAGNIKTGYRLGKLALELQEKFDDKKIKSKVSFLFNNMIRHWQEPAASTLNHFLAGIDHGLEVGDIEHACFHAKYYCTYLFFIGETLPTAEAKSSKQIKMIAHLKQNFQLNYAQIWHQLNLNLQGKVRNKLLLIGESFDEVAMLESWQATNNATALFALYLAKIILCYLFQDYQQGLVYIRQGKKYINAAVGTMCYGEYYFYSCLTMLAEYDLQPEAESINSPKEITIYQEQIKQWAEHAPSNYQHKYELVTAEKARVLGKNEVAAAYYDQAIDGAMEANYLHQSALAEELAGEFYLSQGRIKIASYYLANAYQKYLSWGALAKAGTLESKHRDLLNSALKTASVARCDHQLEEVDEYGDKLDSNLDNFDLFSVLQASQAISSEIILDNLFSKMMLIVMENAGAQKGILILQQNSNWMIAASAFIDSEIRVELPHISLSEYQDLPSSIINYIQSTHKIIMLEEANAQRLFIDDSYIIMNQPQSILCAPIIYQDKLQGIMYLESMVKGAFTSQKSAVLQALLSQVSISIANANLYKDLEDHASVQKSLKQKEILLKEIHHRVKNNLFVVSSLLDFQSNYVDDLEVIKLLENCQNRITAMAMVHQHLYGNSELDRINFADYIQSLLDNLAYSQGSQERNINITLDLEPIELNIESANPCGLIVNELISNALEHGFRDRLSGNIWLKLRHNQDGKVVLVIEDDGVGFKPGLDLHNSDSLGLELVCTLVQQLDGEIELEQTQGTKIEISFDELDYDTRI